ncbi:hypothetical protein [Streptomyces sp. NPDC049887]
MFLTAQWEATASRALALAGGSSGTSTSTVRVAMCAGRSVAIV